ncbi:MAG: chromosome segregation protein [Solirubrobacteraceae bacterium]|nr:chromosome segregation protein [Solirubrobacteraceae bacterium]
MHLKTLSLKGFKSFPDRTRLEFSPGVSVIVGPNGSGKSNITDAVLWALGEQSPLNVRGSSMQDVIFAGAHGVQARAEAEVEVVIDNSDAGVDLPMSEIAISRRLDRAGDGEYRINGARCRLTDVTEVLSDTGLGKEMHSVVSQGRVTAIVTSKPRDRRVLIEEAAGLGKHRKRRRRAQLKLDRTQDNLDRALDVEREARTRLRPLKRQAEAAELHERLERQTLEARWELAKDGSRAARAALASAEQASAAARAAAAEVEGELADVARRREAAEQALTSRGSDREELSGRFHAARSAAERIEAREEAAGSHASAVADRAVRRRALVEALEGEVADEEPDEAGEARVAELERELEQLAADRAERLARELAELEERRSAAAARVAEFAAVVEQRTTARREAETAFDAARAARREAEGGADKARREAARVGSELAGVNRFLQAQAGAPGGAPALADSLRAEPGAELALSAVLGPRLRAAVAGDVAEAAELLGRAGRDGGAALVSGAAPVPARGPEIAGARRLLDHVSASDDAGRAIAAALLGDAWIVDELAGLPEGFTGIAVTREGLVWDGRLGELRRVPGGGEERVLTERNRRDTLVAEAERAAQAEHAAKGRVEAAVAAARATDAKRDEADRAAREAARAHADALEAERQVVRAADGRKRAPDDAETAARRAQLAAALNAERRLLERAAREREARGRRIAHECERADADEALAPVAQRLATALAGAAAAVREQREAFEAQLRAEREAGEALAAELRACAQAEAQVQARLKAQSEAVTRAEVAAQQRRDQARDAEHELTALAERLGLEAEPAAEPLPDEERATLSGRIERLQKRREQLGPVNPLAKQEYDEAVAHVEELEAQREDLETAIRELQGVIRETDQKIKQAFEETFTAAARNFEDLVGQLFPGGRGRLRLVREDAGPRPVLGGGGTDDEAPTSEPEAEPEDEQRLEEEQLGVEIEITPAGKATKRLSLLSGGEKSMTALAFMFAVFLARPCPFYILDEVEAALDEVNIERFLTVLRRYADRAQFIVVTHQKRTMEAADCLYGVSMAGNGVSKVVSRRLPREAAAA